MKCQNASCKNDASMLCPHCLNPYCSRPCQLATHIETKTVHYLPSIEKATLENREYRKILHTTPQMQLVLMEIPPLENIPLEKHKGITQLIWIERGSGEAIVEGKVYNLEDGSSIMIPEDTEHEIRAFEQGLSLYTLYSPPAH